MVLWDVLYYSLIDPIPPTFCHIISCSDERLPKCPLAVLECVDDASPAKTSQLIERGRMDVALSHTPITLEGCPFGPFEMKLDSVMCWLQTWESQALLGWRVLGCIFIFHCRPRVHYNPMAPNNETLMYGIQRLRPLTKYGIAVFTTSTLPALPSPAAAITADNLVICNVSMEKG